MSDKPQKPMPTGKSITEGVSAQAFGGAVGTVWVLNQAANDVHYPAGMELAMGTIFGTVSYVLYKLFAKRIMRWARGNEKDDEAE